MKKLICLLAACIFAGLFTGCKTVWHNENSPALTFVADGGKEIRAPGFNIANLLHVDFGSVHLGVKDSDYERSHSVAMGAGTETQVGKFDNVTTGRHKTRTTGVANYSQAINVEAVKAATSFLTDATLAYFSGGSSEVLKKIADRRTTVGDLSPEEMEKAIGEVKADGNAPGGAASDLESLRSSVVKFH